MLHNFLSDESGATAIEYTLIASMTSIAILTGATTLGGKLADFFSYAAGLFATY